MIQQVNVSLELHKLPIMTNINEQLKDLGKRVKVTALLEIELVCRDCCKHAN